VSRIGLDSVNTEPIKRDAYFRRARRSRFHPHVGNKGRCA
jgi:hypothetical protein